ncbi:MAG: GxxExxY protein [Prevotella sp.]|nr:GxxExxY protein [Prevotella sp.]
MDITKYKEHIYDVVGAIHEVHRELGAGLNEYCYQEGLQLQLQESKIPFKREMTFHPFYHGHEMSAEYRIDFLCKQDIIIECKAVVELSSIHRAQLFNYMRLLNFPCGILVNFAPKFATIERYFLDLERNEIIGTDGKVKQFL